MEYLSIKQTEDMLRYTAARIIENKALLTEVDSKIGDGDHGIGMEVGMTAAIAALDKLSAPASVNELFKTVGRAMTMSMGGASGIIFGTLFQGGVKTTPVSDKLERATLCKLFRGGLDAIKARGGAQVGDKTMVDALEPAVLAMEASPSSDIAELLAEAASAAETGMERTKLYEAKYGRAKSLMARAIGFQDAGATTTWLIFLAMSTFVNEL